MTSVFNRAHKPFELSPAHRALLGDAVGALGVDVEFVVLRQKLDRDAVARLAPGLVDELLFEARQPSLGRSRQILQGAGRRRASR